MTTLDDLKLHLRVDHDEEDDIITMYLGSATAAAANFLNVETLDLDDLLLPAPIKAAIFLAVGDLYANREAVATVPYSTNPTYERLLNPYRVMAV